MNAAGERRTSSVLWPALALASGLVISVAFGVIIIALVQTAAADSSSSYVRGWRFAYELLAGGLLVVAAISFLVTRRLQTVLAIEAVLLWIVAIGQGLLLFRLGGAG